MVNGKLVKHILLLEIQNKELISKKNWAMYLYSSFKLKKGL